MADHKRLEKETLASSKAIAASGTGYSLSMPFDESTGEIALLIVNEGTAITITQQVSLDDVTYYDPVNASSVAQGSVIANLTTTTGTYVHFDPIPAPYTRFKIVATDHNSTTVTMYSLAQKEV
jgi:hypothetical protein